jgi:hypothetical protein
MFGAAGCLWLACCDVPPECRPVSPGTSGWRVGCDGMASDREQSTTSAMSRRQSLPSKARSSSSPSVVPNLYVLPPGHGGSHIRVYMSPGAVVAGSLFRRRPNFAKLHSAIVAAWPDTRIALS